MSLAMFLQLTGDILPRRQQHETQRKLWIDREREKGYFSLSILSTPNSCSLLRRLLKGNEGSFLFVCIFPGGRGSSRKREVQLKRLDRKEVSLFHVEKVSLPFY